MKEKLLLAITITLAVSYLQNGSPSLRLRNSTQIEPVPHHLASSRLDLP